MYGALMTSLFAVAEFGKHDSVQPESSGDNHLVARTRSFGL